MIYTFCEYRVINDDTCNLMEEGDCLDELTYWDDGKKCTLCGVTVTNIADGQIEVETEDYDYATIDVDTIESWE